MARNVRQPIMPGADSPSIACRVNGRTYTVWPREMTGLDSSDYRRESGGSTLRSAITQTDDEDLDTVAAFMWLAMRQAGTPEPFDEIASVLKYDVDIEWLDDVTEDEPEKP